MNITNPLGEDTSVMRTTILPSICETLARNNNYRNPECYVFELGNEYLPAENEILPNEPERLGIGVYDTVSGFDFYDLKGMVENVLDRVGAKNVTFEKADKDCGYDEFYAFHPGRVAVVRVAGTAVGIFGELHPKTLENYGMSMRAYAGKLDLPQIMESSEPQKVYKPLPKYPATTRDIAVVCDDEIPVAELEKAITMAVGSILEKVTLFDVYKGEQIEKGKKSVAYSISMRSHEGTLTDEQADKAMEKVLKELSAIGAELRA